MNSSKKLFGVLVGVLVFLTCIVDVKGIEITTDEIDNLENNEINLNIGDTLIINGNDSIDAMYCRSTNSAFNVTDYYNYCEIKTNNYAKGYIVVDIHENDNNYSKYFYIDSGIDEYLDDILISIPNTIEVFSYNIYDNVPGYININTDCYLNKPSQVCNLSVNYNYSLNTNIPGHESPISKSKEVTLVNKRILTSEYMISDVNKEIHLSLQNYYGSYNNLIFVSTDTSVATIDGTGVIRTIKPGVTKIRVYNKLEYSYQEMELVVKNNTMTPDDLHELYNNSNINININNEYYLNYDGDKISYNNLLNDYLYKEFNNFISSEYFYNGLNNINCLDNVCSFDLSYHYKGENKTLSFSNVTINLEGLYIKNSSTLYKNELFMLDYFNLTNVLEEDITIIYDHNYIQDNLDGTYTSLKAGKTEITLTGGGYTTTKTVYIKYAYEEDNEFLNYYNNYDVTLPYNELSFINYQNLDLLTYLVKNKIIMDCPNEEIRDMLTPEVYCFSSKNCQVKINATIDNQLLIGSYDYKTVNINYQGYDQETIDKINNIDKEILDEYNIDIIDTIKYLDLAKGDLKTLFDSIVNDKLANINSLDVSYDYIDTIELANDLVIGAKYKINIINNGNVIYSKDIIINIDRIVDADVTLDINNLDSYLKEYVDNILMSDVVVSNLYDNVYNITNNDYSFNLMLDKKEAILISSVSLTEDMIELDVGDTKQIEYRIYPTGATYGEITYTSGNEDILSVSEDGIITAHKKGFTYVDIKVNYSTTKLLVAVGMSAKEGLNELLNSLNKDLTINYSVLNIAYYGSFDEALKNAVANKVRDELSMANYYNIIVDVMIDNEEYYVRIKPYNYDEYSDYQLVTIELEGIHLNNDLYTISSGETVDTELFFTEGDNLNLYITINNSDIISYDNNGILTGLKTGIAEVSINDKYKNYSNYFEVIVNYEEYMNNLINEINKTIIEVDYKEIDSYNYEISLYSVVYNLLNANFDLYYLVQTHNISVKCNEDENTCNLSILNNNTNEEYKTDFNFIRVGFKIDEKEVHLDLNEEKDINYEILNDTSNVTISSLNEDICIVEDNKIKGIAPGFCTVKYESDNYVNYQHIIVDEKGIINDYQDKLNNIPDNIEIPTRNFDVNYSDMVYDSSVVLENIYYSYMQQYILDYFYPNMSMNDLMYKLGEVNFNYEDNYIYDTHTSIIKVTPNYYFTDDDYYYSMRLDDSVSKDVVITPVNASDEYIKLGNELRDAIKTQYTLTLKQYLMYELNGREMDMIFYSSFQEDIYNVCPTCEIGPGQGGLGGIGFEGYLMQGMDYMILKDGILIGYYLIEVIADMRVIQEDAVLSEDEFIELIEETVKEEYISALDELEVSRVARMANTLSNEDDIYVNVEKVFDPTTPNLYDITVENINFQTVVNTTVVGEEEYTYSVTDIIFENSAITLDVGESKIIGYTIVPDNATNKDILWESSNPSIVSVDASGAIIARSPGNATITVKSKDGNTTKTINVTVNASETPEIEVTLGDINLDGAINMTDLIKLRKYFAGLETLDERALKNADINKDGTVNMTDIIRLRKYFAGLEDLK